MKKRISNKVYKRLLSKKKKSKREKKTLEKALKQRYCSCLKKLESNPKLNNGAAYAICTSSIYKKRGIPVPKNRNCRKKQTK